MSQDQRPCWTMRLQHRHCPGPLTGTQSVPAPSAYQGAPAARLGHINPCHAQGDPVAAQGPCNPRSGSWRPSDDSAVEWGGGMLNCKAPGFCASVSAVVQGQPDARAGPAQISGSTACCEGVQTKPKCGSWEGANTGPCPLCPLLPGPLGPTSGVLSVRGDNDGTYSVDVP